jgi:hypothetical protein
MEAIMRTVAICVALLLTGCVTQEQRTAQVQRDVQDMIQVYGPGCEKLGYKADTDAWRDCVMKLSTKDNLERYNRYYYDNCVGHAGFLSCTRF